MALWGGRFEGGPDALFKQLNDSLRFDHRLALEDVHASIAWAKAIASAGVLTPEERDQLIKALVDIAQDLTNAPPPAHVWASMTDEDVHSWVERKLVGKLGALGKKLHTGRSRNDQVATDLRLWTRHHVHQRELEILAAQRSLVALAEREIDTVIPGFTHLQRAQPVLLAHWALAYVEMLSRDASRFADARRRMSVCPLGSGALAGTAYAIDRAALAKDLQFDAPSRNSLDAVSDRDFVVESLGACALTATHLSRLGEDIILYASQEFAFFELDDSVASGSSLMPQKKNPDGAELLRAKSGRILGSLVAMLVVLKGLPLAYNKDLQEDKEPLFDAMDQLSLALRVVPRMLDTLKVRRDLARRAALGGHSNATDLADYLVARGVPFREAHEQVGKVVRHALLEGKPIDELHLAEIQAHAPAADAGVFEQITLEAGLARREVLGGTGPRSVREAVASAKARLAAAT